MGSTILAGLAVASHKNNANGVLVATFDHVSVAGQPTEPPAAPSNLQAIAPLDPLSVNLSWTDNATTETGSQIQRATNAQFTQGLVTYNVAANATNFSDTSGLSPGTTYYYRIRATGSEPSAWSNATSATTPTVPAAPSNLQSSLQANPTAVNLTWADNSTNESGFEIQRATDAGFTQNVTLLTASSNSHFDTTVAAGTTYYYRVRARNGAGASAWSNVTSISTPAPSAMLTMTQTTSTSTTYATISDPSVGEADWIKWGEIGGTGPHNVVRKAGVTPQISDDTLVNTTYEENEDQYSPKKISWTGGTPVSTGTNSGRGRKIIGADQGMTFTVPADTSERVLTLYVFGWNSKGKVTASLSDGSAAPVTVGTNGNSSNWAATYTITFKAASAGQTLTVTWLSDPDSAWWGNSGIAGAALKVIQAAPQPPATPVDFNVQAVSPTEVQATWSDVSDETSYTLQWSTSADFSTITGFRSLSANDTSETISGLVEGTQYYFRLKASNADGDSFWATDSVTTPYQVPTIVNAPSSSAHQDPTKLNLSALGATQRGESYLTYHWSVVSKPSGAANPTFNANGTNAAKNTVVTFSKAGNYTLRLEIHNGDQSVAHNFNVTVESTPVSFDVTPATTTLNLNGTQQFAATALDQFGDSVGVTWSVISGGGTIDQNGLYTAPAAAGSATVRATAGSVYDQAVVTINNAGPVVSSGPSATLHPTANTKVNLAVLATDDGGEANLTYTWAAIAKPTAAADPTFTFNGINAAKNTTATLARAGTYTFQVTISDGTNIITPTVQITVDPVATAISITPSSATVEHNETQQFTATVTDQFNQIIPTAPITWSIVSGGGTIGQNGLYTAPATAGLATVRADSGSLHTTADVSIVVSNLAPTDITLSATTVAENQPAGTPVGIFSTIDPDIDDVFTYALVSGDGDTDNASFIIEGNVLKTAAPFDYEAKSSFSIRVRSTDQGGLWTEKVFTVTVGNVNEFPVDIVLSNASVRENQPIGTPVGVFTAVDPDHDESFTYSLVSGEGDADNASFAIDGDILKTAASFNYESKNSYSIRVRATDQNGLSYEKSFIINIVDVAEVNVVPFARDIWYNLSHDRPFSTNAETGVLAFNRDPDGDEMTVTAISGPTYGSLDISSDGTFTYEPYPGYVGVDSFKYVLNDGTGDSNQATVTLNIGNHEPQAGTAMFAVAPGTTLVIDEPAVGLGQFAYDPDGDPLTFTVSGSVGTGSLTVNSDGTLTYIAPAGATGLTTFSYRASDGLSLSQSALAVIYFLDAGIAAVPDTYIARPGKALTVPAERGVLANDRDRDGDPLSAWLTTGPSHGTAQLNSDGSFTYTPWGSFSGTDSFGYQAYDGNGGYAYGVVTIVVTNTAPTPAPDVYEARPNRPLTVPAAEGVLTNDYNAEGDAYTAYLSQDAAHGTLQLNSDGSFVYTPDSGFTGTDSFAYYASDGLSSEPVTVTIIVLNAEPVGTGDIYFIGEGESLTRAADEGVLANDYDPDDDPLTCPPFMYQPL